MLVLGTVMMLLGNLAKGWMTLCTSFGSAFFNWTMWVTTFDASGRYSQGMSLNFSASWPTPCAATTLMNFVPWNVVAIWFIARIVSNALMASLRVSGVWLLTDIFACGSVPDLSRVRPVSSW